MRSVSDIARIAVQRMVGQTTLRDADLEGCMEELDRISQFISSMRRYRPAQLLVWISGLRTRLASAE